jgi:hypothetical protein
MSTGHTMTKQDVITAAASVARDAAEGTLAPAELEAQLVAECRQLFGTVAGEGDPLLPVQIEVARAVLAAGLIPADELAEWLAVARRRESLAPLDAAARSEPARINRIGGADASAYGDSGGQNDGVGD